MVSDDEKRRQVAVDQYAESTAKLDARAALHARFSIAQRSWHEWLFDQVALEPGETVVEMGAGTGLLWTANEAQVPPRARMHLTDLSMPMCRRLRQDVPAAVSVCRADAQRLPFRDQVADVVVANHMLYHVPDQRAALLEAARLLRPGGRAVFATNGREHMKEIDAVLIAAGLPGPAADPTVRAFTLEDAQMVIAPVFPRSIRTTFDDGLRVTEVDAVLAYVESFATLDVGQRRAVEAQIKSRMTDGCMTITKVAGVVVAQAR